MSQFDKQLVKEKVFDFIVMQLTVFELVATLRDEFRIDPDTLARSVYLQFVSRLLEMNVRSFEDNIQKRVPAPSSEDIVNLNVRISKILMETKDTSCPKTIVEEFSENFVEKHYKGSLNDTFFLDSFAGNGTIQ